MMISNAILGALNSAIAVMETGGLDYCLFGGLAMQVYKRIRATRDVDLMVTVDKKRVTELISRMEKAGFEFDRKKGAVRIRDFELFRFIYTDEDLGLDIFVDLATVATEFQKTVLRRKKRLDFLGVAVNIASCEDLILLKALGNRPIDIADAEGLIEENIRDLNKTYLRKWAEELGVGKTVERLLKEKCLT